MARIPAKRCRLRLQSLQQRDRPVPPRAWLVPAARAPRASLVGKWTARFASRVPPADDRRAALLVVAVDLQALPHSVDVVGIAAGERVHGGAILGVDDEHAAA